MRLSALEQSISKHTRTLRLDSIRSRIMVFALLATLIPSATTAWLSYTRIRRSLNTKVTQELESASRQGSREVDLWLKDRLYELRVFASSNAVTDNLEAIRRPATRSPAQRRLGNYLSSVRERFPDYVELLVVDQQGRTVATSARQIRPVHLPQDWSSQVLEDEPALGDPYRDDVLGSAMLVVAVRIPEQAGRFVGALTAKVSLASLDPTLRSFATADSGRLYLVTQQGAMLSGRSVGPEARLSSEQRLRLADQGGAVLRYESFDGTTVLGSMRAIPSVPWYVLAETPTMIAFRQVTRLRNLMLLVLGALLIGIGVIAYLLGILIVRPLQRLTRGAARVAAGSLDVDLPILSGGEVGYLTHVFNNMVARLREGRETLDAVTEMLRRKNEELERLSVTDGLTGLHNRRRLMESLADEVRRSERLKHNFAVLMVDVDHFKKYNDTFGHPAGDDVLARVAAMLREATREVDDVARYGGEEFVVVLPETAMPEALEIAERVRARVASEAFPGRRITVSIGVAEYPTHGDTPDQVIGAADEALYEAKREGRDRVRRAGLKLVRRPPPKERAGTG
jgi:diguanylate cyclase (GGDEF)-like protein